MLDLQPLKSYSEQKQEMPCHLYREPINKNKQNRANIYNIIHIWSNKAFNFTVVNQALSYLHGGFLEITLTVPLTYLGSIWGTSAASASTSGVKDYLGVSVCVDYMPGGGGFSIQQAQQGPSNFH